jgi:hypothetical protein
MNDPELSYSELLIRLITLDNESRDPSQSGVYCYGDVLAFITADNLTLAVVGKTVRLPSRSGLVPQVQPGGYHHLDDKRCCKAR